jgi:tRNA A37 N6-isopentenylltransferase MiaA
VCTKKPDCCLQPSNTHKTQTQQRSQLARLQIVAAASCQLLEQCADARAEAVREHGALKAASAAASAGKTAGCGCPALLAEANYADTNLAAALGNNLRQVQAALIVTLASVATVRLRLCVCG